MGVGADGWLRAEKTGRAALSQVFDRDAAGHVLRQYDSFVSTDALGVLFPVSGQERVYARRPDGQVATMTERGVVQTFSYDDLAGTLNNLGWIDTLGRSRTFVRDARGNVIQTSDGTATTFTDYDARDRVIETRDALGNATTYGYSHAGCGCSQADHVTSIHTPDLPAGVAWEMAYDAQSRLASVTDPHGFTARPSPSRARATWHRSVQQPKLARPHVFRRIHRPPVTLPTRIRDSDSALARRPAEKESAFDLPTRPARHRERRRDVHHALSDHAWSQLAWKITTSAIGKREHSSRRVTPPAAVAGSDEGPVVGLATSTS